LIVRSSLCAKASSARCGCSASPLWRSLNRATSRNYARSRPLMVSAYPRRRLAGGVPQPALHANAPL